jgi:two-component system chemotaxis response regulator CheY
MSYNVLVVDDSRVMRRAVRKCLGMSATPLGSVFEASDGLEALDVLGRNWIDIVFTDINMPGMDGLEFMKRIAQLEPEERVPVVVVSSMRSDALTAELRALGVRAYIHKPFQPETFRAVLASVLQGESGESHGS